MGDLDDPIFLAANWGVGLVCLHIVFQFAIGNKLYAMASWDSVFERFKRRLAGGVGNYLFKGGRSC